MDKPSENHRTCHPETPTQPSATPLVQEEPRVGAILVIALVDGQIRPYRNAPVPWQQPAVPAKAGKDLSFIVPVSVSLNGSVLERSFTALCFVQDDMKRRFSRFLTHNKRLCV